MSSRKILGADAWRAAATKPLSRWFDDTQRFHNDLAKVRHEPKFSLGMDDKFFCIGSCFARNIEEHLIYRGVEVLSKRIFSPKSECAARVNGFVNKFTPQSMFNEIDWALCAPIIDERLFEEGTSGWSDLQLSPGIPQVSLERAIERRTYLTEDYFSRIGDATVVILTLGLNEVWFDNKSQRHLNCAPSYGTTKREPERFELHVTDVNQNIAELEKIRTAILSINPNCRLIVTVSPVPLSETFSGRDIVVANMYSKSTLRVAAEMFAADKQDVDYFPSYDMVAMSPRDRAYGVDCLHVSDQIVGQIMQEFLRLYIGIEAVAEDFTELSYLAANPDVEEAVRLAIFSSGFEHWQNYGKTEGRLLAPAAGPTELMISAGISRS